MMAILIAWRTLGSCYIGSHAASHRPLTALPLAEIVREDARSRAILARELGVPITAFAYPYGGIHVRRDELVSVMYSTELNSTTSLVPPQRTDRHGILDEKPPHFQRLSR